jgi:hypothetical protein
MRKLCQRAQNLTKLHIKSQQLPTSFTLLSTLAFFSSSCMLTPITLTSPRHLSPDAPACNPCPWPVLMRTPTPSHLHRFNASHVQRAALRCVEVAQQHPSWPRSRVRATVARELGVATTQLRYLLSQAAQQPKQPAAPDPDTNALAA